MFVRINNSFINLSVVTGVYQSKDNPNRCKLFYINGRDITLDVSLDEFVKEVEKQAKKAMNLLETKNEATIEDRFRLMDLEVN